MLQKGGVILYPTDTVWGIGCDATNPEAVAKVYEIKRRDDSKALVCLVDSDARLQRYVRNVPDVAWQLIDAVVKPTTLILDEAVNLAPNLIGEDGSIGIRITNEPFSKGKYQWRTCCTELSRYFRRNIIGCRLRLYFSPTRA